MERPPGREAADWPAQKLPGGPAGLRRMYLANRHDGPRIGWPLAGGLAWLPLVSCGFIFSKWGGIMFVWYFPHLLNGLCNTYLSLSIYTQHCSYNDGMMFWLSWHSSI